MTTQLLSSGEFCKLRYDTIPVKSASASVSLSTSNSKMPNFEFDALVANKRFNQHQQRLVFYLFIQINQPTRCSNFSGLLLVV
jgi:hypothetical protein